MTARSPAQPLSASYACGETRHDLPRPLGLVVLGATGSIGRQTLDLVRRHPDRLQVAAVSCHRNLDVLREELGLLASVCPDQPRPLVAVTDPDARRAAAADPDLAGQLLGEGSGALVEAVAETPGAHCLVNGLVGARGLAPTLAGARRGLRIALANKESLVVGGDLVARAVRESGAELLPVDSEHAAIAQCLSGRQPGEIERLVLTASGGPFRTTPAEELATVTLAQVLDHPTWDMGPKITVDSATLMNKGLEVIEAHHLFGLPFQAIDVVVHPGSVVHSLVEFVDGALLAQLGTADMRIPLLYAICGERHLPLDTGRLDLLAASPLRFEPPDPERFPCLALARQAGEAGGAAPAVLNAANEVAVQALLDGHLGYTDIPRVIAECLAADIGEPFNDLAGALAVDAAARRHAAAVVGRHGPNTEV